MAAVVVTRAALTDLERIDDAAQETSASFARVLRSQLLEVFALLERHPLLGREAERGLRELVISRGKTGYLALYRFDRRRDTVLILRVRHQREAGYREPGA